MRKLEDPRLGRFQKGGFSPTVEQYLHALLGDSSGRGSRKYSTSRRACTNIGDTDGDLSGYTPEHYEDSPRDQGSYVDLLGDLTLNMDPHLEANSWSQSHGVIQSPTLQTPMTRFTSSLGESSSLGKRGSSSEDSGGCKKTRRMRQYEENSKALQSIEENFRTANVRGAENSKFMRSLMQEVETAHAKKDEFTVGDALARLYSMEGLDQESDLFLFASSLVSDEGKRDVLHGHKSDAVALRWLRYEYNNFFK